METFGWTAIGKAGKMRKEVKYLIFNRFHKHNQTNQIWWGKDETFTFDKKTIYGLWSDYPDNLSPEEKEIFDEENPDWVEYFDDRSEGINLLYRFWKDHENDRVWNAKKRWVLERGPIEFSFDRKKIYNFWTDYPWKFTPEEKEIFDKEQPYWENRRSGKKKDNSPSIRQSRYWDNYFSGNT